MGATDCVEGGLDSDFAQPALQQFGVLVWEGKVICPMDDDHRALDLGRKWTCKHDSH